MIIECLPHQTKRAVHIVNVDGNFWRNIHRSIFGKNPKLPKNCANLKELEIQFAELEYKKARHFTLILLGRGNIPSAQIRRKLQDRFISTEAIEKILEECQKNKYSDDNSWTEFFVKQAVKKNKGPQWIELKLRAKGIDSTLIQNSLTKFCTPDSQKENLQTLIEKKAKSLDMKSLGAKRKLAASLIRQGYPIQDVISSLEEISH